MPLPDRDVPVVPWNYKKPLEFQISDVYSGDATEISDVNDIDTVYGESDTGSDAGSEYTPATPKKKTPILPYLITLYGVTEQGNSVALEVHNYKPHFYIEIPRGAPRTTSEAIKRILKKGVFPAAYDKVVFEEVKKGKLYGYTNRAKFNFLRVEVPNMSVFYRMRKQLLTKKSGSCKNFPLPGFHRPVKLEIYESNIDPLLKFFHARDAKPAGWIKLERGLYEACETETTAQYSMQCDWSDLIAQNDKIDVAPLIIASWDIECGSSHGDFPLAIKGYGKVATEAYDFIKKATADGKPVPALCDLVIEAIWPALVAEPVGMSRLYIKKECECCGYTNPTCVRKKTRLPGSALPPMAASTRAKTYIDYIKTRIGKKIPDTVAGKDKHADRIAALAQFMETNLVQELPVAGDEVIQIGTTLKRISEPVSDKYIFTLKSCDPIPGATVYSFEKESDLLMAWASFIRKKDPDVMVGYNIASFDERYIYERAQECGCHEEFATMLGRMPNRPAKLELKELSSAAMGQNKMATIEMPGRVRLDLFQYIKRNYALDSYKLDSVAAVFMASDVIEATGPSGKPLGKGADACKPGQTFTLKSKSVEGLRVGHYVTLTDQMGEPVDNKFVVDEIIDKCVKCKNNSSDPIDATPKSWSQAKDDIHASDIFRLQRGTAKDRAIVAKYCIQDCDLVMDIEVKLKAYMNAMAMANVCSVPVSFIFNRGQGVKIESLIFKECGNNDILIKVLPKPRQNEVATDSVIGTAPDEDEEEEDDEDEDESYEGAVVLKPRTGFYGDNPVVVLDYASLYPSSMISENISHDSLVWVRDYDLEGKWTNSDDPEATSEYDSIPGVRYIDIEYDILKPDPADMFTKKGKPKKHPRQVKLGLRVCRYAQFPGEEKGTMGIILKKLLGARKATRLAAAKEDKDSFKYALLDMMQNAYKITANSLYGQLGSATSKIRCVPLAASTTAYGRKQIMYSKAVIEELWAGRADCDAEAVCVYGDSVTGDTPILVQYEDETCEYVEIQNLVKQWYTRADGKMFGVPTTPVKVWSDKGFTPLQNVIKHGLGPEKNIMRVRTLHGYVDCTDDHSLIRSNGTEISPKDLCVGMDLMHCEFTNVKMRKMNSEKCDEAFANEKMALAYSYAWKYGIGQPYLYEDGGMGYCGAVYDAKYVPHYGVTSISNISVNRSQTTFVYDLTTENHHFAVGPGSLVVHNTDSLFIAFNPKDPATGKKLTGWDAVEASVRIGEEAGHLISSTLKAPQDFEFDKVFWPFVLLSKKRYIGHMYEEPEKGPRSYKVKPMGIALKRRDNAPIVKEVYWGAVKAILEKRSIPDACAFIKARLAELAGGKIPLRKLLISKSLKATYANRASIAHAVLADRIGVREPGSAPQSGDRMTFAYVLPAPGEPAPKTQGDRIETPAYITENKLRIDYKHYITNQLFKPIGQFMAVMLESIPGFEKLGRSSAYYTGIEEKEIERQRFANGRIDEKAVLKKIEKTRMDDVEKLLFSESLNMATHSATGQTTIGGSVPTVPDVVITKRKKAA